MEREWGRTKRAFRASDTNTCGNDWLGFYYACAQLGYFPGGIGFCGSWGSTVGRMLQCGRDNGKMTSR